MLDGRRGGGETRAPRGHKSKLLFPQHLSSTCSSLESASANILMEKCQRPTQKDTNTVILQLEPPFIQNNYVHQSGNAFFRMIFKENLS